jgi:hypothetical protein
LDSLLSKFVARIGARPPSLSGEISSLLPFSKLRTFQYSFETSCPYQLQFCHSLFKACTTFNISSSNTCCSPKSLLNFTVVQASKASIIIGFDIYGLVEDMEAKTSPSLFRFSNDLSHTHLFILLHLLLRLFRRKMILVFYGIW